MAGDAQSPQLMAVCMAVSGCCGLVSSWQLPLQRQDVVHFLAPLALLLGSGAAVLARQPCLFMQIYCAAALADLQPQAAYTVLNAQTQLEAVASVICGAHAELGVQEAAAAIAEAAGPPQRAVRWLLLVSKPLLELPSEPASSHNPGLSRCVGF